MALAPGSRLGRYEIVRQLGAGAMGEVYLAEDPNIERRLAIKTVRLDAQAEAADPMHTQLRLRLEREAKAAGRLIHPNVVTLFDAGEIEGVFFLAFEFVDGSDLAHRARQTPPLELPEILRIGREAAAALEAAHRVGIVHRDIKPSNLLLTAEGRLKVADFGIASLVGQETHLTKTGSLIGTPQYLSPEQVGGEPLDARSDLFSLGVVLYELLGGKRPFDGPSLPGLLYAIVMTEPVPLAELRPDLPPRLCATVMRLLAKQPDRRFPTAAALGEEIAAIEREMDEPAAATRVDVPQQRSVPETMKLDGAVAPRRGRLVPLVVVVAAVILLGVLAALQYRRIATARGARATPPTATDSSTHGNGEQPGTSPSVVVPSIPGNDGRATTEQSRHVPSPEPAAEYLPVGGVVTFRVSPAEASDRAVVKIDGLVRGLASGSMMTLRPGRHEIEVVAEGFATETVFVDSRTGASAPTEVEINLERQ